MNAEAPPILDVIDVSKSYGSVTAIDEVSVRVERGQFLTMLGPSGSGKTTTLRVIAGFLTPDSGTVKLNGKDLGRTPPEKRNIGVVFQNYALFPNMTAAENVAFPLEARRVPRAEVRQKVKRTLALVGLSDRAERYPRELSGGQQQRVALARALVFDPEILLLDEPLGALDRKLRLAMQLEIMSIVEQLGTTVVSVTHDQEEALAMSDLIAIYNEGKVVQVGTPSDLYERPASWFVADFVGESNMLYGTLGETASHTVVRGESWEVRSPDGATRAIPSGSSVALMVRPEDLHVCPVGEGEDSTNARNGTLREIVFLGSDWKYVVDLDDGNEVQARVARRYVDSALTPGAPVEVRWKPAHSVVVPFDDPRRADTVRAAAAA